MFIGLALGLGLLPEIRAGGGVVGPAGDPPLLNDPAATARGMVIDSLGPDQLSVALNDSDRRTYCLPVPPAGSVVSFDLTTTVSFYLRVDDESGLASPYQELWNTAVAGIFHVEVTIPALSGRTLLGFLSAASSGTIQITNWRVTRPVVVPVAPNNTAAPAITGTAQVGQALTASTGTWTGDAPITYEYAWQFSANGSTGWADIAGATTSTFTPQVAQQGLYLRARVRGTNTAGQSGWAVSTSTGQVAAAPPVLAAPTRQTAPTVAGIFQLGQTLTADQPAVYTGNPAPAISYRWQMRPAGGGTITTLNSGPSLTLTETHVGMQIRLQDMASNSQGSTVWTGATWLGPVAAAPTGPTLKPGTLTNPPFSLNLGWNSPSDMSHNPWLDWMKTGMPWGNWDGPEGLISAGHTNRAGDVLSVPAGGVSSYILYNLPANSGASGHYRCTWTGTGTVQVLGAQNVSTISANRIEFDHTATGSGFVEIRVSAVTSGPIKVSVVHQNDWAAADAGGVWRTAWLDMIRNSRVLRFKDWGRVDNYRGGTSWALRTPETATSMMSDSGVAIEAMIDLCNLIGADPWFCLPHTVDADFVSQFAALALGRLNADRHVYVEWSNKVWDGNLQQSGWHSAQAGAVLGDSDTEGLAEFYGGKAADMATAWRAVWTGANAARLHTVLQVWTDNHYFESFAMDAPRWRALQAGRPAPKSVMTEYAVHGLMDGGLRYDWGSGAGNAVTGVQAWMDAGYTDSQIWDRMALACRNKANSFDEGRTLEGEVEHWTAHKSVADAAGLTMIMYEGGTHIVTPGSEAGKQRWNDLYNGFHASSQWAAVFDDLITAWYGVVGPAGMVNRMCDIMKPGPNQNEGLLRYVGDSTPQWTAWTTQQAARPGATGRGASDFIGAYDHAVAG